MGPNLLAANQHSFTRQVTVYVPAKYVAGTAAPFMVIQDGPGTVQVQQTGLLSGLGAGHCDGRVQNLTMADTLLWVWQGYPLN